MGGTLSTTKAINLVVKSWSATQSRRQNVCRWGASASSRRSKAASARQIPGFGRQPWTPVIPAEALSATEAGFATAEPKACMLVSDQAEGLSSTTSGCCATGGAQEKGRANLCESWVYPPSAVPAFPPRADVRSEWMPAAKRVGRCNNVDWSPKDLLPTTKSTILLANKNAQAAVRRISK